MVKTGGNNVVDRVLKFGYKHPYVSGILVVSAMQLAKKLANKVKYRMSKKIILEVDLTSGLMMTDYPLDKGFMAQLMKENRNKLHYRDIVEAIELATKDSRVFALVARIGNYEGMMRYGHAEEIRTAIAEFSKKKLSIAYSEAFGEMGNQMTGFYLASAFTEIHMFPSGLFDFTGFHFQKSFLKGTLDKLEIQAIVKKRAEYKSALDPLHREEMTKYDKEQTQKIMDDLKNEMVKQIAEGRKVSVEKVEKWINHGFFSAKEAKEEGIVTHLSFRDEIYESLRKKVGVSKVQQLNLLFLKVYREREGIRHPSSLLPWKKDKIAIIYTNGSIVTGTENSQEDPRVSYNSIFGHDVARRIRAATLNKHIKAIIVRVNSPGGSGAGSDAICREIIRAKEKGIKVIISMGNVAASGGYWISMCADKIVCNGLALTGSIGVVGGKLYLKNFWKKLGISFDDVASHKFSRIWSLNQQWNDAEDAEIDKLFDLMYNDFKEKVSKGRNIPREKVDELAKGHVYTGFHAKEIGLVDEVGGLSQAIVTAKEMLGYGPEDRIKVVTFPEKNKVLNLMSLLKKKEIKNSNDQDQEAQYVNTTISSPTSGVWGFVMNRFSSLFSIFGFNTHELYSQLSDPFPMHRQNRIIQKTPAVLAFSESASSFC